MTRARGHNLQRATAAYLARWWPHCESVPNGRPGRDILGTPGVWFEVKTSFAGTSARAVVKDTADAATHSITTDRATWTDLPVVVYWPPAEKHPDGTVRRGVGARSPHEAIAMLPLPELMRLLVEAGYAPKPTEDQ